jgi:ubiquinone/menaquinone biosynthesis C-methylase UbiE
VGCGTGTLALAAAQRIHDGTAHGVDASVEMISCARAKAARRGSKVQFQVADACALPFPDGAFDVALCTLALHHLPETERPAAFAEMRRVLRPGGRALIVEFSRAQEPGAPFSLISWLHRRKGGRTLEEAAGALTAVAFDDVRTGSLGIAGLKYALARR